MTTALHSPGFELKLATLQESGVFAGYASVFGGLDSFGDTIQRGAFTRSLAEHKAAHRSLPMLWHHRVNEPIGRWDAIAEDARGLAVEGKLTLEVQQAREAYALMRDRAVTGLSIGYQTRTSYRDKKTNARVLTDVSLVEISIVSLPADEAARIASVKAADTIKSIREFEAALRDVVGFSRNDAKTLASGGWPALNSRDANSEATMGLAAHLRKQVAVLKRSSHPWMK